ncbi:MAG TPA: radical SAM protein [Deltaproteobacteria bacterium]|nr:radical SAM protein [Deltaproteobacteria bacterium]
MPMSYKKYLKAFVKKIVPPVVISNVKGTVDAIRTYYPDFIFGDGKVRSLRSVCIEVTFKCNCRCQMCPLYGVQVDGGKELLESIGKEPEMTVEEFKMLFDGLKKMGTQSVAFSGGEAFLRKDMADITRLAKDAGFEVHFTSNGGILNKEIARWVVELGVDNITISLDGPKKLHEEIRKAKVFDRIMEGVDFIEEEKKKQGKEKPTLGFLCTVSALNQDNLSGLVAIAKSKGVPLVIDPIIFVSEEGWQETMKAFDSDFIKQESFIMPEDIGRVDVDVLEHELREVLREAKELDQEVHVSIVGEETRRKFFNDINYSIVNKCFAPWYSCRVDPYGNVYPCSLSISMGNLRESGIQDIVNGEKFVDFRRKLKKNGLLPFCKKCCVLYSHNSYWNYLPRI